MGLLISGSSKCGSELRKRRSPIGGSAALASGIAAQLLNGTVLSPEDFTDQESEECCQGINIININNCY